MAPSQKVRGVGLEPTRIAPTDLKTVTLTMLGHPRIRPQPDAD